MRVGARGPRVAMSSQQASRWVRGFAGAIAENKQYLTKLDAAIGDGDHGTNMDRGMQAAIAKLDDLPRDDIGTLLKTVGMTLVSKVGGAGGPLYGTLFMQMGTAAAGKNELGEQDFQEAFASGVKGVQLRGKAGPGDKTMLDALIPARDALAVALDEHAPLEEALRRAASAARAGMEATVPLVARKGRASYLGQRSAGHQDPGATSSHLLVLTAAEAVKQGSG